VEVLLALTPATTPAVVVCATRSSTTSMIQVMKEKPGDPNFHHLRATERVITLGGRS